MRNKKLVFSLILSTVFIVFLVFSVIIPTFSRFNSGMDNLEWDGLVATGFKSGSGTIEDPYIISTPNEFAYFASSMENEDYKDKYIKLTKDIVINKGVFKDKTYLYNEKTYYLSNDGEYYQDKQLKDKVGSINVLPIINGFKGSFDGDFHTIYGLYEKDNELNALFTNFSGELKNLYMDNSYISGGYITAGVIANANDAIIKNVIFNGNVIGNSQIKEDNKSIKLDDFTVTDTYTKTIDIPVISNIGKNTLKGTCSNTDIFTLNEKEYACEYFEIEIDNNIEINVLEEASFKDIVYEINYKENKTSGIIGVSSNTEIDGVVNKGNITGVYTSGIIGTSINTNIKNSYNIGKITGERSSGIIDTIMYSNSVIDSVYNNGELSSDIKYGLVSNVYNSNIVVDKTFNTYDAYMINSDSSTIEVNNSYNKKNYTDKSFKVLNIDLIKNLYPEYINKDNIENGNIWVNDEIPILYFDDINNRTVKVKIAKSVWDKLKKDITDIRYDNEVEVLISTTDMYKPIKNVWYYVSNEEIDKKDLEKLSWTEYKGIFSLDNKVCILYVKYEDYNDNVYYINTDKLRINVDKSQTGIKNKDMLWDTYHTPINKFLNRNSEYTVTDNGTGLIISKIEYLVSNDVLSKKDLEEKEWNNYNGKIETNLDSYIIYVKVTDIDSTITYMNTDRMINMSYEISNLKSGNDISFSNYMSYNSSFNFKVSLNHKVDISNFHRYIKVDKKLPNNTKITLKDKKGYYYEYIVTDHEYDNNLKSYLYPLSGFKKAGKITFDEYFKDSDYDLEVDEEFNIFIDFKNISKTTKDYNLSIISKGSSTIYTLEESDIKFSLIETDSNAISITSNYNNTIDYGIENSYNIDLNLNRVDFSYNNREILNTNLEGLYKGIYIEVYDNDNKIVPRDELKDIRFKYNDGVYVFDTNNRVNINLGNINNQDINLDIMTYSGNTSIDDTYSLKIKGYLSIDGINKKYISSDEVIIPLRFNKTDNLDYSLDIGLVEPIINKGGNFSFNISYDGVLNDPYIKVSLYKKSKLTAYNQEYELVDLKDYVSNKLTKASDSSYKIGLHDIVFKTKNNIDSNGYKFVFELYDAENKVKEVSVMTIIR